MPEDSTPELRRSIDLVPSPDPTEMTTKAVDRASAQWDKNLKDAIEQIETRLDATDKLMDERLETVYRRIVETVESCYEKVSSLDKILTERDRRYQERFEAQSMAVKEAFDSADRAVKAAFTSSETAVKAAMESSDKAITKAEVSIEKRADATYVALGELQRMLQDLVPRNEANAKFLNMEERTLANTTRIERMEAIKTGGKEQLSGIYALVGFIISLVVLGGILAAAGVFNTNP